MNAEIVRALGSMTEKAIVEQLGWEAFLKYKEAVYRSQSDRFRAQFNITEYLGMTADEYAAFAGQGKISDRVKRVWS